MATYMRVAFVPLPGSVAAVAAGSVAAIVVLGLVGTWRALGQRPGPLLRHA
jgi:putative ABC transport system permease protein